ncbi:restriction endonuclease subunit S [Campylobacter lanienae]|uniref:restriction endonuclease subunit S n=1 Tax=Campylobacter lanienae TaxID=75658 RepID=UPI0021C06655|nr:restriction endonuclease subunit S [Campylobacter lanienae]
MSKLEELINKLCPNGVEFYMLGVLEDNSYIKLGRGNVISKDEIRSIPGDYPVYSSSSTGDGEIGRYGKYMFDDERITWSIDGGGKFFYRNNLKYSVTNVGGWIKVLDEKFINTKFLYYILINSWATQEYNYTKKAHPSIIRNEYSIPVPPLEVQCEIVRILDNFTLLSAELSAELSARQKQYNFYKDELIKNAPNAEFKTLEEISTDMYRGVGIKRDEITEAGIPCVRYGEIYTTYNVLFDTCVSHTDEEKQKSKKYFEYGDILFAITGESVEEIGKSIAYLGNDRCLAGGDIVVMKHNQNPKYIAYALSTTEAQIQKSKGKVKSKVVHSSVPALKEISIPIPSLDEQERIANLIENFDKLCNDISEGLPAEIEARKKQYEFYRDKLLTFKELKK